MSRKRTLDNFFKPLSQHQLGQDTQVTTTTNNNTKKQRIDPNSDLNLPPNPDLDLTPSAVSHSTHPTYPFPIPHLPASILSALDPTTTTSTSTSTPPSPSATNPTCPFTPAHPITHPPLLDLLHFSPFLPPPTSPHLFAFLRSSLPFYRVRYSIRRNGPNSTPTLITTPRYTTVFGVDESSAFASTSTSTADDALTLVDRLARTPAAPTKYRCRPRPLPACLDALRGAIERATGERFNFCLVNYYADGDDSIAYHADDERFLGRDPVIASVSLGARRDFLMRRKQGGEEKVKLALGSGDVVVMRGTTQKEWEHSVPKRKGGESARGRVNVTFRKAMVRAGTENYYRYNVGDGPVFRWDEGRGEMRVWEGEGKGETEGEVKGEIEEEAKEEVKEEVKEEGGEEGGESKLA